MPPPDPNSAANKALDRALAFAEEGTERIRVRIAEHADNLARHCSRLAAAAADPGARFHPNSIGEVQGAANVLDALCGQYGAASDVRDYLRSLVATEGTVPS